MKSNVKFFTTPAWITLCVGLAFWATTANAATFYVATNGSDTWSGTLSAPNADATDGPFATLERAKRALSGQNGGEIVLRGGIYTLEHEVTFGLAESGTEKSPVLVRAAEGEVVTLSGGRVIDNFVPWRGKIYKSDAAAVGLKGVYFRQLVCDGRRQILARYPNFDAKNPYGGGWAYADGKPVPMYAEVPGEDRHTFTFKECDRRDWKKPTELRVMVFPRYNWWNNICDVASIDPQTRVVKLAQDASYAIRPNDRYYFENALEELDAPGEWYLDKSSDTLYFWPPEDGSRKDINDRTITASMNPTLLRVRDAKHILFQGLIFENASRDGIIMENSNDCVLESCVIRNIGQYHSTAMYTTRCVRCGVRSCDFSYTGSTAFSMDGGDLKTLTPGENFAENCHIHHTGLDYKQGVGITMTGVGNRASHNLIHDCPRFGIGFGGNNQIIEFNEIHHVNLETSDTGAVYTGGRNWLSSRGTQIRYNYFHDILGFGFSDGEWKSPHYCWGIYLDDNAGGVDVYGNLVTGCIRGLIHLHNGRDNHIWNNVFINGTLNQFEANGWTESSGSWKSHYPTMVAGYESVAGLPAWKTMRHMELHPKDAPHPDGTIMDGNRLWNNIFYYDSETSYCFGTGNFFSKYNSSDRNLIWNQGKPVRVKTNELPAGEQGTPVPLKNANFEAGKAGELPPGWRWQVKPSAKESVALDDSANAPEGKMCLRLDSDYVSEKKSDNTPCFQLPNIPLECGKTYRMTGKFRASEPETFVLFHVHHYTPNEHYWGGRGNGLAGLEWTEISHTFRIPAEGESGWKPCMTTFNLTLGNPSKEKPATIYVDDIHIEEIPASDSFEFWQSLGFDTHSVVADPKFEDAAHGDYRLKKDSPAWKLGFQPVPFEQMGLQDTPERRKLPAD